MRPRKSLLHLGSVGGYQRRGLGLLRHIPRCQRIGYQIGRSGRGRGVGVDGSIAGRDDIGHRLLVRRAEPRNGQELEDHRGIVQIERRLIRDQSGKVTEVELAIKWRQHRERIQQLGVPQEARWIPRLSGAQRIERREVETGRQAKSRQGLRGCFCENVAERWSHPRLLKQLKACLRLQIDQNRR